MSALNIPDEASAAGWDELMAARETNAELQQAYARALHAAASLIVAAELDRLANEIWQELESKDDEDYSDGVDEAVRLIRTRAAELRGES